MKPSADVVLTYGPPYGCVTAVSFYKISLSLFRQKLQPLPHSNQEID